MRHTEGEKERVSDRERERERERLRDRDREREIHTNTLRGVIIENCERFIDDNKYNCITNIDMEQKKNSTIKIKVIILWRYTILTNKIGNQFR